MRVLLHSELYLGNVLEGGCSAGWRRSIRGRALVIRASTPSTTCWTALDIGRLIAWCRAVAPIVAIIYLERPGREQAISELLALAR
jgi:hypothetical protein